MNNGNSAPDTAAGGKTLELTDYDLQRRAHKAITDSSEIRISTRLLSAELCCPICLDLLTTTMTTKECLHRFCSECITTALLRGNKECPTCRKKLVSKRSLRPDPNFDALINKVVFFLLVNEKSPVVMLLVLLESRFVDHFQIWPDRQIYEQMQQKAMDMFHQQCNVEALQKSIEAGMKAQAANRRQRVQGSYDYERRKRRPRAENQDRSNNNTPDSNSNSPEGSGEGDLDVADQCNERSDEVASSGGGIMPGTSTTALTTIDGTSNFANANGVAVSHSANNNNNVSSTDVSDDSMECSTDSSSIDSSDSTDSTSTSSTSSNSIPTPPNSNPAIHNTPTLLNVATTTDNMQNAALAVNDDQRPIIPPLNACTLKDKMHKWLEENPSSPLTPDESMAEQLERQVDEDLDISERRAEGDYIEIEAELLPAKSMFKRFGVAPSLLNRRYIRTREDTTMEHLGEFIYQVCCCEEAESGHSSNLSTAASICDNGDDDYNSRINVKIDNGDSSTEQSASVSETTASTADSLDTSSRSSASNVQRPEHFYVYVRYFYDVIINSRFGGRSVNKIFGNESVLSALHAQRRGDHLMIFFDVAPLDLHSKSVLEEIVYDDFLK
ncbi:unnamed protein product [Anisakis simplex]|uniref:RING-type E3 ubiquitin transferase n=1 Tax=Anisakis simplex TaxID=6269 RepID=A0A0M3JTF3_ANISI|nr:unnamed protein product [Anisakis simplex]